MDNKHLNGMQDDKFTRMASESSEELAAFFEFAVRRSTAADLYKIVKVKLNQHIHI